MPRYILFLRHSGDFPSDISPADIQAIIQRYVTWRQRVQQSGHAIEGHKLAEGDGRVLRGKPSAARVTDGPFAEAREVMGGLFLIEAANYDEVVALSRDCPHLDFGSIEIREVQPT
jgi:hypothetical protein